LGEPLNSVAKPEPLRGRAGRTAPKLIYLANNYFNHIISPGPYADSNPSPTGVKAEPFGVPRQSRGLSHLITFGKTGGSARLPKEQKASAASPRRHLQMASHAGLGLVVNTLEIQARQIRARPKQPQEPGRFNPGTVVTDSYRSRLCASSNA
jgi:hypothetical protein